MSSKSQVQNNGPFSAADLPIVDGLVYHLRLAPGDLAPNILLVGDPGRAESFAEEFLSEVTVRSTNRGLVSITGRFIDDGTPVSIITSGMGTPSLEIVVAEILALNEMDFESGVRKAELPTLNIIRVGTSGGIQPKTAPGTSVISTHAIGIDNAGWFLDSPLTEAEEKLCEMVSRVLQDSRGHPAKGREPVVPYASTAHPEVVQALIHSAGLLRPQFGWKSGITVSAPGFFWAQGRDVFRVPPTYPEFVERCSRVRFHGDPQGTIENFEMEAAMLFRMAAAHGYRAGAICVAIANRSAGEFPVDYEQAVKEAGLIAFRALSTLASR